MIYMDSLRITVVVAIVVVIFCVIVYYLYQETKFKKMVENSFNQKTDDVLMQGKNNIVFGGESLNRGIQVDDDILQKDKLDIFETRVEVEVLDTVDPILANEEETKLSKRIDKDELDIFVVKEEQVIPADSMEAFFAKFDKIEFPFLNELDDSLDLVIDLVLEENIKIKNLCEISQFTQKKFQFYVLDKNNSWLKFEFGKKYVISGLRLIVELVDRDGIINQAQISNMYDILYRFALEHHGHIRCSDYLSDLEKIKNMVNQIEAIELDLNLYLVTQDDISYFDLAKFLSMNNFVAENGVFRYKQDGVPLFEISDENSNEFSKDKNYHLFTITSKMHLQKDPLKTTEEILDFMEIFMNNFESRILTANKLVFGDKEYRALIAYVYDYVKKLEKYDIKIGGTLLQRVC